MPLRGSLLLWLLALACTEEVPVTGGFRETIVDRSIRHGQQIGVADFDDDGRTDIVAALSLTDAVNLYLNGAEQAFEPISISGPGSIVAIDIAIFDADGDSDLDVAAAGLSQRSFFGRSAGEVVWYENPGDPRGVWITHPILAPDLSSTSSKSVDLPWGATSLEPADLDGDGAVDLILAQRNAPDDRGTVYGNRLVWFRNDGAVFVGPIPIDLVANDPVVVRSADVDGDGRLDIFAGADLGQELAWYQNESGVQGDLRFVKYSIAGDIRVHAVEFGDLDSDGDSELAVAGYSLTSSVTLSIFDPPASLAEPWTRTEVARGFGSSLADRPNLAAGDFDGDGAIDLAITSSGGDLRVYRRDGTTYRQEDVRGGYRGLTGLARADIDGDGRLDLITSTFEFGSRDRIAWWRNESFGP